MKLFFTTCMLSCTFALQAEAAPVLPFVDNVRTRFEPSGDATWVTAGAIPWDAKITATDMTPDGKYLAIGDNNGNVALFDMQKQQTLWKVPVIAGGEAVHALKMDATGSQLLAAKTPGQNDFSHTYYIAGDGAVTDMGVQEAFSPQCAEVTKMDPTQFLWSPDGTTFFTLYETHARGNRGSCQVAAEKYIVANDMAKSTVDIRLIALEPFNAPEEGEPDTVWCTGVQRMAISRDGKTVASSHCNGRIVLWFYARGKLTHKKTSQGIAYMLRRSGYDPVNGAGFMAFNRRGEIYFGMGAPGAMAKSAIVRMSPDLKKAELLAYVHMPYPKPMLSADENYLMAGSDIVFLWDLRKKQRLFYGPSGRNDGIQAQMHPKKRLVMLPSESQILYLSESPAVKLNLTGDWKKTGRLIRKGDTVYVAGPGRFGYGYGEWLREDWKQPGIWLSEFGGDAQGDAGELIELSLRSESGGAFLLYGGRPKSTGGDPLKQSRNW